MSSEDKIADLSTDEQLRRRAVQRLKARAGFSTHLLIYLTVNTFIVVIWAVTSGGLGEHVGALGVVDDAAHVGSD